MTSISKLNKAELKNELEQKIKTIETLDDEVANLRGSVSFYQVENDSLRDQLREERELSNTQHQRLEDGYKKSISDRDKKIGELTTKVNEMDYRFEQLNNFYIFADGKWKQIGSLPVRIILRIYRLFVK